MKMLAQILDLSYAASLGADSCASRSFSARRPALEALRLKAGEFW
jgi:hypothetical protein